MRAFILKRLRGSLLVLILFVSAAQAQQDSAHKNPTGIFSNPKLQPYRKSANDYFGSFKNRYALDELKKMDAAADTLAVADMQKAESELKQKQEAETKEQVAKINEQTTQIKSLNDQNEVLRGERNKLWRKAVLSIVIWLIMVALYVVYRLRMFSSTNKTLKESELALANAERFHEKGEKLMHRVAANAAILKEAGDISERISSALQQPNNALPDVSDELLQSVGIVKTMIDVNNRLLLLTEELPDEKKPVDVNVLCEQVVLFANNGIETEDGVYYFTITKDLEKKLPLVNAHEQGLARVLVFLISNALNACYRQAQSGVKGYQPKVIVSTRVLPRFVQIKVKDNGSGVSDDVQEAIYDPYFTTEARKKAGLGLTLCKQIVEKDKGEIKIESVLERGTDVTIKLFLESK